MDRADEREESSAKRKNESRRYIRHAVDVDIEMNRGEKRATKHKSGKTGF